MNKFQRMLERATITSVKAVANTANASKRFYHETGETRKQIKTAARNTWNDCYGKTGDK